VCVWDFCSISQSDHDVERLYIATMESKLFAILFWMCIFVRSGLGGVSLCGNLGRRLGLCEDVQTEEPFPTPVPVPPSSPEQVIQTRMGGNVQKKKYDNQLYVGESGGPINSGDDLECNFQGFCCWDNVAQPTDQFDWSWASGTSDPQKLKDNFGTTIAPTGRYLMASRVRSRATDEAMFTSCTVTCTNRPINVKFRHWTTPGVQLQVCSSETFFNENNKIQLINCKDVRRNASPGPSTVTIPPGDFLDIIFVASNFQDVQGGIAIIDDIIVDFTPCPNKPTGGKKNGRQ